VRLNHLKGWKNFSVLASLVWVAGAAHYGLWQHNTEAQRLSHWADTVEWVINADASVPVSAKELRSKLGDEQFIVAAAAAYPRVDLRETIRRYERDRVNRPRYEHPVVALVSWALIPPALLYGLGMMVGWISSLRRRRE